MPSGTRRELDGGAVARRGYRELGEPEWSVTIFGLPLLAELLTLDAAPAVAASG